MSYPLTFRLKIIRIEQVEYKIFETITNISLVIIMYNTIIRGTQREYSLKPLKHSIVQRIFCLLYTSPSPRDLSTSRMPSSA